jgi:hypothetical protein
MLKLVSPMILGWGQGAVASLQHREFDKENKEDFEFH